MQIRQSQLRKNIEVDIPISRDPDYSPITFDFLDLFNDVELAELFGKNTTKEKLQKQLHPSYEDLKEKPIKNWKYQAFFSEELSVITGKVDPGFYELIRYQNNSKLLAHLVRLFLVDQKFRILVILYCYHQRKKDLVFFSRKPGEEDDYEETFLERMKRLQRLFPHSISTKIYNYEKILLNYYSTFVIDLKVVYVVRCLLLFDWEERLPQSRITTPQIDLYDTPQILQQIESDRSFFKRCFVCPRFLLGTNLKKCVHCDLFTEQQKGGE